MEGELLTSVPEELKRLVRLIVRGFYTMDAAVVIDMLVRHPCVKEDDLCDLLKYEKKQIRSILNVLKNEKFLKSRMRVETDKEGQTSRHNYYFINYSVFVNVVKYKLDHMRRKIETDERDNTARSSFKCPGCGKTFTDYEVGQLLDPFTGELHCTYCNLIVEEDESSIPKQDARTLLARFNEQIQPIYELLRSCEDVKLAPEVLDPEPTDIKKLIGRTSAPTHRPPVDTDKATWSGEATKHVGFGYSENTVTITIDDTESTTVETREQPVWMTQSTIDGTATTDAVAQEGGSKPDTDKKSQKTNEDILQTLLAHEQQRATPATRIPAGDSSDGGQSGGEQAGKDVEEMESDSDDDGGPMVQIGSERVSYHSVTADMVARMSALEKEEYIRTGQQLYENMYD